MYHMHTHMKYMFNKTSSKFIVGLFAIIAVGLILLFVLSFTNPEAQEERQAKQYLDDLREQYETDTYGGTTPEETLVLFISALEVGDIDLASKYFVVDEQERWKENLVRIKDAELLEEMVGDLKQLKKTKEESNEVFYTLTNVQDVVSIQLILELIPYNEKWKITEL
jgi:hypothetical protein